jgi:hypothetical protein
MNLSNSTTFFFLTPLNFILTSLTNYNRHRFFIYWRHTRGHGFDAESGLKKILFYQTELILCVQCDLEYCANVCFFKLTVLLFSLNHSALPTITNLFPLCNTQLSSSVTPSSSLGMINLFFPHSFFPMTLIPFYGHPPITPMREGS